MIVDTIQDEYLFGKLRANTASQHKVGTILLSISWAQTIEEHNKNVTPDELERAKSTIMGSSKKSRKLILSSFLLRKKTIS